MSQIQKLVLGSLSIFFILAFMSCLLVAAQTDSEKPQDVAEPAKPATAKPDESPQEEKPSVPKEFKDGTDDVPANYWIGVQIVPVPDLLLSHFGVKEQDGSLIAVDRVLPEGPAEKAGVQRGDVILKFGGKDIRSLPDLIDEVNSAKETATPLEIIRDGAKKTLTVTPISRPVEFQNIPGVLNLRGANPRMPQFGRPIPPNALQGQDQQQLMRKMEEFFRQMQGGVDNEEQLPIPILPKDPKAPQLPGISGQKDSGRQLSIAKQTVNGKTTIKVTQVIRKDGNAEEKTWEVESIDELPEDIQAEVKKVFRE